LPATLQCCIGKWRVEGIAVTRHDVFTISFLLVSAVDDDEESAAYSGLSNSVFRSCYISQLCPSEG